MFRHTCTYSVTCILLPCQMDYDRYMIDACQQFYAEQSDDLSSIYLRDNLHGNIHGGAGIFGAATIMPVAWVRTSAVVWAYTPDGFPLPTLPQ